MERSEIPASQPPKCWDYAPLHPSLRFLSHDPARPIFKAFIGPMLAGVLVFDYVIGPIANEL